MREWSFKVFTSPYAHCVDSAEESFEQDAGHVLINSIEWHHRVSGRKTFRHWSNVDSKIREADTGYGPRYWLKIVGKLRASQQQISEIREVFRESICSRIQLKKLNGGER